MRNRWRVTGFLWALHLLPSCGLRRSSESIGWTVSGKEGADRGDSNAFEFAGSGAVIPCVHGLVDGYPQQHSDKMAGGQHRIIDAEEFAVGEASKAGSQSGEDPIEAVLVPAAAHIGKSLRVGHHEPA